MVSHLEQSARLHLLVVEGDGPFLVGRDWLHKLHIKLEQLTIFHTHYMSNLESVLVKHSAVFHVELGQLKDISVKLHVIHDCKPTLCTHTQLIPLSHFVQSRQGTSKCGCFEQTTSD